MAEMLRSSLRGDIELRITVDPGVGAVEVDVGEFEIALLNVAVNARDAMPKGGQFVIDVRGAGPESQPPPLPPARLGYMVIVARDNGIGMSEDVIARASEPFFTTKTLGSGTGLGLSQVFAFAKSSNGAASIRSRPGEGTRIAIFLPITDKKHPAAVPAVHEEPPPRLAGRVLLVDDNEEVMMVTKAMIEAMGLEVETANRAAGALERLASDSVRFNLLLTDVVMPDMSGADLANEVRRCYADLPIVLMSGYHDASTPNEFCTLRKPVPYDELREVIQKSLTASR